MPVTDDQFFMPRHDQAALVAILRTIPGLVEDLAVTVTRQDRLTTGRPRISTGEQEQPLPFNVNASDAGDYLHFVLAQWARLVLDQRGLEYDGTDATTSVAAWLDRNIISLAMTEGAETALDEIRAAVSQATRACDRPRDPRWMRASVEDAANTRLNARGIEALAKELGGEWAGINRDRVRTLHRAKRIAPVAVDKGSDEQLMFAAGDVLAAHIAFPAGPSRKKRSA